MPRRSKFKIKWFRWYIVDMTNWHRPVIVKKHFESQEVADKFNQKYFGKWEFKVVSGEEAKDLKLTAWHTIDKKYRHRQSMMSKYEYPPWIKDWYEKKKFRTHYNQKRKRQLRKAMQITIKDVINILDGRCILFCRRVEGFKNNHYAYSNPSKGLQTYIETYKWPKVVVKLHMIELTLKYYKYDLGIWEPHVVAMMIYKHWGDTIEKFIWDGRPGSNGKKVNLSKIKAEYFARGFIKPNSEFNLVGGSGHIVKTIHIKPTLVYPEYGYFGWYSLQKGYKHYIYDLASYVAIPGFGGASIIEKRG